MVLGQPDTSEPGYRLPRGLNAREAVFLLGVFARLKEKGSGRLEVTVSDGRIVDIQLVERLDWKTLAEPDRPG
jgi:hypothetical protein